MRICSCEIDGFGKFHHRKFEFSGGINLIYGENESGKSTLHTFIRAMLYGLKRKRGRASKTDDYTKYYPWDSEGGYGGSLIFESGGKHFLLKRDFLKGDSSLVCLDDHENLSVENGDLEMLLGGYGEAVFQETLSVPQMYDPDGKTLMGFLKDRESGYQNMEQAGEYDSPPGAPRSLQQVQKRLNTHRRECRKKLEELEREKEEGQIRRDTEIRAAEKRVQNAERILQKEEQDTAVRGEELRKKIDEISAGSMGKYSRNAVETGSQSETETTEKVPDRRNQGRFPAAGIAALAVLAVLLILRQIFPGTGSISSPQGVILTMGMAASFAVFLISFLHYYKKPDDTKEKPDMEKPYSGFMKGTADSEIGKKVTDSGKAPTVSVEDSPDIGQVEELKRQLRQLNWNLEYRRQDLEEERARLEAIRNESHFSELPDSGGTDPGRRISDAEAELDAVQLAIRTLQILAEQNSGTLGNRISGHASEILVELTGGKYSAVQADGEQLNLFDGERYVPAGSVSRGTREQVYFSLRMAAAWAVYEKEDRIILLDEALIAYDDRRLAAALGWLGHCGEQVLLFTCQRREERLMEQNGIPYRRMCLQKGQAG